MPDSRDFVIRRTSDGGRQERATREEVPRSAEEMQRVRRQPRGISIAFYSFSGGTGQTTVALHVADALAELVGRGRVVYVDLGRPLGGVRTLYRVEVPYSVTALAPVLGDDHRSHSELIHEFRAIVTEGIFKGLPIVPGSSRLDDARQWPDSHLPALVELALETYPIGCFDLPHDPTEPLSSLMAPFDLCVIVVTPEPAALRACALGLREIRSDNRCVVIVNRFDSKRHPKPQEISSALQTPVIGTIVEDAEATGNLIQQHRLAIEALDRRKYWLPSDVWKVATAIVQTVGAATNTGTR